jgi:MHS family proline/betaine transporter-like MFS transporter
VETPAFVEYKQFLKKETVPIKLLFTRYKKPLFQMLGMGGFLASSLVVFNFYITSYLSIFYHFPQERLAQFSPYTIFIFVIGAFAAGCFDKWFSKKFFILFTVIFIPALLLLFKAYPSLSMFQIFFFHSLILLGLGIIDGRFPVLSASFFPVAVRYSGVAFIYNISFGIVTGCTQMILTWLIKATGLLWIPALYICFFAFLFLLSLTSVKSNQFVEYQK